MDNLLRLIDGLNGTLSALTKLSEITMSFDVDDDKYISETLKSTCRCIQDASDRILVLGGWAK